MEEQKDRSNQDPLARAQDSLTPVTVQDISLDQEAAAMNKGKGRTIFGLIAVLVVCIVGAGVLLKRADKDAAYREVGETLTIVKKQQFDRFWGCALEGVDLSDINSNAALVAKIESRSSVAPLRYAKSVRNRCLDILDEIATSLDIIQIPSDLQKQVGEIRKTTNELRDAWREYLSVITDQEHPYDEAKARPSLEKIAQGWYRFTKEHANLSNILEKKL